MKKSIDENLERKNNTEEDKSGKCNSGKKIMEGCMVVAVFILFYRLLRSKDDVWES